MSTKSLIGVIVVIVVLVLANMSTFTINPAQSAIMLRFGKIVKTDFKPGLHFKTPFINQVVRLDKRILTLDSRPERFLTVNKKNLLVDYFAKWQIVKPVKFYRATGGSEVTARKRLGEIIKNKLRAQIGSRTVREVVTAERAELMHKLRDEASQSSHDFGVEIVDVRIKRIDLPKEVSSAVFNRMRSERAKVAKRYRAEGSKLAEKIRATADKKYTIILADAHRKADKLHGEGDATATNIYASAYNKDPEFYSFYRSLNAYKDSLKGKNSVLVLSPDSEFFKYLESP